MQTPQLLMTAQETADCLLQHQIALQTMTTIMLLYYIIYYIRFII